MIQIRILGPEDEALLMAAETDVFDHTMRPASVREFLQDARHHIAAAVEGDRLVGFASAVHYIHPDKPPELWINEVSVGAGYRRTGLATRLLGALFGRGRELECVEAWVLTDRSNRAAMALYAGLGGREFDEDVVMYSYVLDGMPNPNPDHPNTSPTNHDPPD